ncbi:MAG: hypothetical protein PF486_02725 [Prolixibacteraceae bacterium]|nr:hypothetical protein [Prolixibacteraceae bacterium]
MILKISGLIAVAIFIFVSLGFVSSEREKIACNSLQVVFNDPYQFVTSNAVKELVHGSVKGLSGSLMDTIDSELIEEKIEELAWIKNAEVFKGYGQSDSIRFVGGLKIYLEQEVPVLRVVDGADGYYLNSFGKKIPFSLTHTMNVPVFTGAVSDSLVQKDLLRFVDVISQDAFLSSLFQQVDVQNDGELVLVPRVGDHLIMFGKIENMEKKFRNLQAVYKKGMNNGKWNKYKSITLKYENQVVCTLK